MIAMDILKKVPMFTGLSDKEMEKIASLLQTREFKANEIVVKEGDLAYELYIIKAGSVEVIKGDKVLARLWEGDAFGEMALIDVQPRSASVRTKRDCTLYSLSNKDFLTLFQWHLHTYTIIVLNLAKELSRRLRKAQLTIAEYSKSSPDEK